MLWNRFPNAGKSTLLSRLSTARPKIAQYPFTTLRPQFGVIMYPTYTQISVADLPGLIEGAHRNRGMGHKFLKHVQRTKLLLFVVDVHGFQLSYKTPFRSAFETVQLLTKELELYDEWLLNKPVILVINKLDLPGAKARCEELVQQLHTRASINSALLHDQKHTLPTPSGRGMIYENPIT
uniref:GTP-binding protein 10 n=1 Tax=Eptatretus burgeri TaxID=7764 RepID=A0A8C4WY63_EPTBU